MKYGISNESDYFNYFNDSILNGISNFIFKGDNGVSNSFMNIKKVEHVKKITHRSRGICNKGDIILYDTFNNMFPLSLKMNGVKTAWESADSTLKHILYQFVDCYGKIDIPNASRIVIEEHNEELEKYVFGDDIINNGSIIVQTLKYTNCIQYNSNTSIINCHRLYNTYSDITIDNDYTPVIAVRKDDGRNKKDHKISGYRIEVVPRHITTSIIDII